MTVTPQTNVDLAAIAARMKELDSFALCGHVNPDGDCLGSQLALAWALRSLGKTADVLLARHDDLDAGMRSLPGSEDLLPAGEYAGSPQAFVACDVPTTERLGEAAAVQARCQETFTVDHHAVETCMSRHNYVDPDAAATALIVWNLVKELGVTPDARIAQCAYAGLMTDTGSFRHQNADSACFVAAAEMVAAGAQPDVAAVAFFQNRSLASLRLMERMLEHAEFDLDAGLAISYVTLQDFAACEAVRADAEPLIDVLRSVSGVRVAAILRENGGEVRGSLRAKDATDVSRVARSYGGGGHVAAAGFTYEGALSDALRDVRAALLEALDADGGR